MSTEASPEAAWLIIASSMALQSIELAQNESLTEEVRVAITAQLMAMAIMYWTIYKSQSAITAATAISK